MHSTYGQTWSGQEVHRIELSGHGFRAHVLTLGAILQQFWIGNAPLTLGADALEPYDSSRPDPGPMRYYGAVIGPVAGRISGARGMLDGTEITMEATAGPNSLHSGAAGLNAKVWRIEQVSTQSVTLETTAAPGEGGLPGTRRFRATYALEEAGLRLGLQAQTDTATWINLTQHSYWQLLGAPTIDGHALQIAASRYLPLDDAVLPVGEIAAVEGTRFDFRESRQVHAGDRLDHCFCLDTPGMGHVAARLVAPQVRALELWTDAPGLQTHTIDAAVAPSRPGIAFEAQDWPDAPNQASFPSIRVGAGEAWRREMLFAVTAGV